MAGRFVPRINLDGAAYPHAKWLQDGRLEHDDEIKTLKAELAKIRQEMATGARQTAEVNVAATDVMDRFAASRDLGFLAVKVSAAGGVGASVSLIGTASAGSLVLITGSAPSTSGWSDLVTFTNPMWTDESVPAIILYPGNEAAVGTVNHGRRQDDFVEVWFDMAVNISAATTYRFHYKLEPLA